MSQPMTDFLIGLLTNFIASFAAVLFAIVVRDRLFNRYRYDGSRVRVTRQGEQITSRDISWRKAKEIAEEPSDLSVFLKGVASPYAWITCDLIAEGEQLGLLSIERRRKFLIGESRVYTIDINKNPKPDKSRYEGWRVRVLKNGHERVNRSISVARAESALGDADDLAAFATSVAAPFGRFDCDPVGEGQDIGALVVDEPNRVITIDLDKLPAPEVTGK